MFTDLQQRGILMMETLWWTMMTTNQKGNLKDAGDLTKGKVHPGQPL